MKMPLLPASEEILVGGALGLVNCDQSFGFGIELNLNSGMIKNVAPRGMAQSSGHRAQRQVTSQRLLDDRLLFEGRSWFGCAE